MHRLDCDYAAGCKNTNLRYMDETFNYFFRDRILHPVPGWEGAPHFPVDVEVTANALMRSRLWLGEYENHAWNASYDGEQDFDLHAVHSSIDILAKWDSREYRSGSDISERRFDEDGGEDSWHWFCQLLAASPPVHFPRATS